MRRKLRPEHPQKPPCLKGGHHVRHNDKPDLKVIPTIEVDPFDPEAIRLSPADQQVAGEKLLVSVPVRKPNKAEFFRVNADPAFTCDTALLEVEGEFFLVLPRSARRPAGRHQARPDLHLLRPHGRRVPLAGAASGRRRSR